MPKNTRWRKYNLFNKWCWDNCIFIRRRMKLDPYCTSYTNVNSKEIEDLNIRPNAVKLLEEEILWKIFHNIDVSSDFLDMTPKAQATKAKVNKCKYIKWNKMFLHSKKETTNKMKRQPLGRVRWLQHSGRPRRVDHGVKRPRPSWSAWWNPISTKNTKISWVWWHTPVSPSYLGGWGRRITRTQEAEVAVSQDGATALQAGWQTCSQMTLTYI